MFSYCQSRTLHHTDSVLTNRIDGIAASFTTALINYVFLGFQFDVDGYYMHSFEIWLAAMVVFIGLGNISFSLLEYRLGQKPLVG